jgi:hypothetical protein
MDLTAVTQLIIKQKEIKIHLVGVNIISQTLVIIQTIQIIQMMQTIILDYHSIHLDVMMDVIHYHAVLNLNTL